jgi:hypothetical protein
MKFFGVISTTKVSAGNGIELAPERTVEKPPKGWSPKTNEQKMLGNV